MKTLALTSLFSILLSLPGCGNGLNAVIPKPNSNSIPQPLVQERKVSMPPSGATIKPTGPNQWLIQVERTCQSESGLGEVTIEQAASPNPASLPHSALAGSLAWLELGERSLASHHIDNAISCAQSGLDELGSDYASPLVDDDTELKLLAASERIENGHSEDGARVMLRVLRIRTELYKELHKSTMVK